jgi:nucleotide-binding universal stress UspA family protein
MPRRLSVVCAVDFSGPSTSALRFAAAFAEARDGRLTVLTVDDPLLEAMDAAVGRVSLAEQTRKELRKLTTDVLGERAAALDLQLEVAMGKPHEEILRFADEHSADLIVMSSHGLTGLRKLFFGSTTERVLRAARVPVLVSGAASHAPADLAAARTAINRILVPVDLDRTASRTLHAACELAEIMAAPLLVAHVLEPARLPFSRRAQSVQLDRERRARADDFIERLASEIPKGIAAETLVAYGDPAEEIAKIARDRHAGLIVMPVCSPEEGAARLGSVAFRVLSLTSTLVLALPGSGAPKGQAQLGDSAAAFAIL